MKSNVIKIIKINNTVIEIKLLMGNSTLDTAVEGGLKILKVDLRQFG